MASQNLTDPRLGKLGLDLLRRGYSAKAVVDELVKAGAYPQYRQIGVVDIVGGTAAHTGSQVYMENNEYLGDGVVAVGNLLFSETSLSRLLSGRGLRPIRTSTWRNGC